MFIKIYAVARFTGFVFVLLNPDPGVALRFTPGFLLSPASQAEEALVRRLYALKIPSSSLGCFEHFHEWFRLERLHVNQFQIFLDVF